MKKKIVKYYFELRSIFTTKTIKIYKHTLKANKMT